MDTTYPVTAPHATTAPGAAPAAALRPVLVARNPVARVGLGVAIAGLVVAAIPFACFFAWFLTLPALVLGIVGATRKHRPRRAAAWAIGLSVGGWLVSLAMAYVTFAVFGTVSFSAGA